MLKSGARRVTVEIRPGEELMLKPDSGQFYKLGYPMNDDVIEGHILADMTPVIWDSLSQKWID